MELSFSIQHNYYHNSFFFGIYSNLIVNANNKRLQFIIQFYYYTIIMTIFNEYQQCVSEEGFCVGRSPNRFFNINLCLENVSSGEKRAEFER